MDSSGRFMFPAVHRGIHLSALIAFGALQHDSGATLAHEDALTAFATVHPHGSFNLHGPTAPISRTVGAPAHRRIQSTGRRESPASGPQGRAVLVPGGTRGPRPQCASGQMRGMRPDALAFWLTLGTVPSALRYSCSSSV